LRQYFGNRPPLGAQISLNASIGTQSDAASKKPVTRTIVGVVGDTRTSYVKSAGPQIYLPLAQAPSSVMLLLAKTAPHVRVAKTIASAVTAVDPLLAAPQVYPLDDYLMKGAAQARLSAITLLALGFVAFVLSVAGIYAVVSYGVAQRTHELGVRIALGALAADIVRDVLIPALRIAGIGVLAGVALAAFGARAIADQLYGITPFDPPTFAVVIVVIVLASIAAALIPARRATRVDPIVALRYE